MLVDLVSTIYYPRIMAEMTGPPYPQSSNMDADGEFCAVVLAIPRTGNITKIGIRTGTCSTPADLLVALETVDAATGRPTGTLYKTNSSGVVTPSATTVHFVTLTAPAAAVRGDLVAVTVRWNGAAGNVNITLNCSNWGVGHFPYQVTYLNSTWAVSTYQPLVLIEYSDGTIVPIAGALPAATINAAGTFSSASNPNIRGARFRLPYGARVSGLWIAANIAGNTDLILFDPDGVTALETIAIDSDLRGGVSNPSRLFFPLITPRILERNVYYRIALKPGATTISYPNIVMTNDGAAVANGALAGPDFGYTTANIGGGGNPTQESDWTNTADTAVAMGLIIDQIDDAAKPYRWRGSQGRRG